MPSWPGSMLMDGPEQATVLLADRQGAPEAGATVCFADHVNNSHHRSAWVGMATVEPALRGTDSGRYVNAVAIPCALMILDAE